MEIFSKKDSLPEIPYNFIEMTKDFYISLALSTSKPQEPYLATERNPIPVTAFYVKEFDQSRGFSDDEIAIAQESILPHLSQFKAQRKTPTMEKVEVEEPIMEYEELADGSKVLAIQTIDRPSNEVKALCNNTQAFM
jgi:hypothetical protein